MTSLIELLKNDPVEQVRATAASALGKFAALVEMGKLLSKDKDRLTQTLLCVLQEAREGEDVRRRALEAIAPLNSPEVSGYIQAAYASSKPKMKVSALHAMGRTCSSEWLPTLLQELKNDDAEVRYEAVSGCGELGDRAAVPYLIPLTQDGDSEVQLSVIQALGRLGGRIAKNVLTQSARSPEPRLREAALDALETLQAEESPLTPVFDD